MKNFDRLCTLLLFFFTSTLCGVLFRCSSGRMPDRGTDFTSISHLSDNYVDICEVKTGSNETNQQSLVRIKGEITGFYEILLFSKHCPGLDHIVRLDLKWDDRERLLKQMNTGANVAPNITLKVMLMWLADWLLTGPKYTNIRLISSTLTYLRFQLNHQL